MRKKKTHSKLPFSLRVVFVYMKFPLKERPFQQSNSAGAGLFSYERFN